MDKLTERLEALQLKLDKSGPQGRIVAKVNLVTAHLLN